MGLTKKAAYAVGMIRKHGLRGLAIKVMETKYEPIDHEYTKNWQNYMVTKEEWKVQRNTLFEHMPLVSVVVPLYETPECFLRELIEGMLGQSYENWELCLADGSPTDKIERFLAENYKEDARIRYRRLLEMVGFQRIPMRQLRWQSVNISDYWTMMMCWLPMPFMKWCGC